MQDFPKQVRMALEVYCKRGEVALKYFSEQNFEGVEKMLQLRSAAFHNFCAIDDLARKTGYDAKTDPQVNLLIETLRGVNEKLELCVRAMRDQLGNEMARLRKTRQKLGKYRSGNLTDNRFEKSV